MKRITGILLLILITMTFAACGQGSNTSQTENTLTWQEQYDLGVRYLSEGNYEEAIIAFTAAIEIDPKRAETYISLAEAYEGSGDLEQAMQILLDALDVVGDSAAIQNRLEAFAQIRNPEPESETKPEFTSESDPEPELTVTSATLAYAPTIEESQWYCLENHPTYNDHYIISFNFSQTDECDFAYGYVDSYWAMFATGTYSLNGNVFQFETTDIEIPNDETGEFEYYTGDAVLSGTYTVEMTDADTLLLTQISGEGFFVYHEAGHQIVLKKGYYS